MSRVLSGSRRVLNDTIVNIHSSCQSYKNLVIKGVHVLQRVQAVSLRQDSDLESLGVIIKDMGDLVQKLRSYSDQLSSLSELNKAKGLVPFVTWSYQDFSDVGFEVYKSYEKETDIKVMIAHSIRNCKKEQQLDFCLIGWTHCVYTVDEVKFEAMLHECGLK